LAPADDNIVVALTLLMAALGKYWIYFWFRHLKVTTLWE
jgi:hypothetical protein